MKKIVVVILLIVAIVFIVQANRPQTTTKSIKTESKVDVDFTALNETMRSVKEVEFMRNPAAFANKTIRIKGEAAYRVDENDNQLYGISVYDSGGCCPLFILEYRPIKVSNPLPEAGSELIVEGILRYHASPTNAIVYIGQAKVKEVNALPSPGNL